MAVGMPEMFIEKLWPVLGMTEELIGDKERSVGAGGSSIANSDAVVITIARALLSGLPPTPFP